MTGRKTTRENQVPIAGVTAPWPTSSDISVQLKSPKAESQSPKEIGGLAVLVRRLTDVHTRSVALSLAWQKDVYPGVHLLPANFVYMPLNSYESTLLAALFTSILFAWSIIHPIFVPRIGFYISSALRCSSILWNRFKAKGRVHPYLLATHIALVLLVTTRCIAVLVRAMLPSINKTYTIRNMWTWDTLFVDSLWMIALLLSDVLMAYRLYVEADSTLAKQNEAKYYRRLDNISIIFMIATFVLNIFNTGIIAYRIWSVRRRTASSRTVPQDALANLVSLLVESEHFSLRKKTAAIYTTVIVIDIILLGLGKILFLVFTDIQTPLIGIVFSSIIISVTQGSAFGDTSLSGGTSGDHVTWPRTSQNPGRGSGPIPTEINMHTIITTQKDPALPQSPSPVSPGFGKTHLMDSNSRMERYSNSLVNGRGYIDLGIKPGLDV
ncbi:hypothetical protein EV368DRAFT_62235 [Lentinula lateritia]|nr:hypothetical protein EV368DRAFT_62235 [Lentinula lateritia]